jgi:hypothetical protein
MRNINMCPFLIVSRPFQTNYGWRGASSHGLSLSFEAKIVVLIKINLIHRPAAVA